VKEKENEKRKNGGFKGVRSGCIKKPSGKKLPACGVNLILRKDEDYTRQALGYLEGCMDDLMKKGY
jgi:hypothetical protein